MNLLWHKKGVKLYHGTAEEFCNDYPRADLLLTDPPYGQNLARSRMGAHRPHTAMTRGKLDRPGKPVPDNTRFAGSLKWDSAPADPLTILRLRGLSKYQVIFGGHLFGLPPNRGWLIWDKCHDADFAHCEMAWSNLDQPIRRIRHRWNGMIQEKGHREKRWHPCQKPQRVLDWILDFIPGIKSVADPYAGGGSTGLACLRRRLQCVMVEREEVNCGVIIERLEKEGRQWL